MDGRTEGRGGTEGKGEQRGELSCSLGRDDGQKEGPFAQIRLTLSTRDRGAPEWGKEQTERKEHEDISWFVRIVWSVLGIESVRVTQSLTRSARSAAAAVITSES